MTGLIVYVVFENNGKDMWYSVDTVMNAMSRASAHGKKMEYSYAQESDFKKFYEKHAVKKKSTSLDDIDDEFGEEVYFPDYARYAYYEGTPHEGIYKEIMSDYNEEAMIEWTI